MVPELRVASPCTADWERMAGDDRVRHCAECNLDVYNFSALTSSEIAQLLTTSKGQRLCGRLYRRADGTLLTRDCPVGLRVRVKRVSRRIAVALSAVMSTSFVAAQNPKQNTPPLVQIAPASVPAEFVVSDVTRAVIPHARVEIWSSAKLIVEGGTDASGRFSVQLAPGSYEVAAIATGFTAGHARFSVSNSELEIPLSLEIGKFEMGAIAEFYVPALEPSSSTVSDFLPEPAPLKSSQTTSKTTKK
jgi:hypothetical protein